MIIKINIGCTLVDNHIPWDDNFDFHLLRECNIYIIFYVMIIGLLMKTYTA